MQRRTSVEWSIVLPLFWPRNKYNIEKQIIYMLWRVYLSSSMLVKDILHLFLEANSSTIFSRLISASYDRLNQSQGIRKKCQQDLGNNYIYIWIPMFTYYFRPEIHMIFHVCFHTNISRSRNSFIFSIFINSYINICLYIYTIYIPIKYYLI